MRTNGRPSSRPFIRLLAIAPVLASFTVTASATKLGPSLGGCAQASSLHHVALVVEHGTGAVVTRCVSFTEDSITGDQLLARSRLQYATAVYGGIGNAVCQIDGEPAQYPPGCWTASSRYWATFDSRGGGSWAFSSLGISSQTLRDGDAEGFRYEGQSDYSVPPSPQGVCPLATSPTPAPVTTARPAPSGATTHPSRPSSTLSSGTPTATAAAPSADAGQPSSASPSSSATVRATVATRSTTPPSQPPLLSTGAWAASGLATVLLVLVALQLVRPRRRPPPPRSQP